MTEVNLGQIEPEVGLEPTTWALRKPCSATELRRPILEIA